MAASGVAETLGLGVSIEDVTTAYDLYVALTVRLRSAEHRTQTLRGRYRIEKTPAYLVKAELGRHEKDFHRGSQ